MSVAAASVTAIRPSGISPAPGTGPASRSGSAGGGFASALEGAVQSVDQQVQQADQAVQSFLNGGNAELHQVALSVQRASLAFDLGMQVRNKVVSAYQEVMKMQI
ncbi:MAG TPA: flagellar hook-basal body complex protein FliE [Bryobacteraceae bacterium]|nr:flagellar hook-basal body complex protein FliE [Bryobacteraceae bacterium]